MTNADRPGRGHTAEQELLSALLWHEDAEAVRSIARDYPDLFFIWDAVWEYVRDFVAQRGRVPKARTVEGRFKDKGFEFVSAPEPVEHYVQMVLQWHQWQAVHRAGLPIMDAFEQYQARLMEDDPDAAQVALQQVAISAQSAAILGSSDSAPGWETPIPFGRTGQPASFPVDVLPDWLAAYVTAEATATQTPVDLAGMLALAVLAAAAGGLMEVEVRPGWVEPVNLFVVAAMTPGSRKSAVYKDVTRPLVDLERELVEGRADDVLRKETERDIAEQVGIAHRFIAVPSLGPSLCRPSLP